MIRKLTVRLDWGTRELIVGALAEQDRRIYFEYAASFLGNALPISPIKLPVRPGLFEHTEREFAELFGAFNDSLPDGWGLLLMDRELRKRGWALADVSPLDRLAYIGTRGMGALTYHPPGEESGSDDMAVDLAALARQADRVLEGSAEDVLPALRIAGGSPGGARPKVLVGVRDDGQMIAGTSAIPDGYRHFLVKFRAQGDPADIGAIEAAYALMAGIAGITVPSTRLFETSDGGRYFGTQRFDRDGNHRIHMHTLGGLFHASHRLPSMDYEGYLKATRIMTRDERQVEEGYRRMAFNVMAHNRDDHVKNFSYLMGPDGTWHLAPAYDLVFSEGPRGRHAMAVAGEDERPGDREMLRVAEDTGIDTSRARAIIQHVRAAVMQWPRHAQATGVSNATGRRIGQILDGSAIRR